ncbi:MAG: GumC family protein [Acidobacteriota bacterium]
MNHENKPSIEERKEVSFFDLIIALIVNWKLLILVPFVAGSVALGVSYIIPPTYTASTKFLPPQQQQSVAASMVQNLGSLAPLAGAATGLKNAGDQYVSFLKSRSIQDALVTRMDLLVRYNATIREDAYATLSGNTRATSGKDGLITVEVDDRDPSFAAKVANAYVEELSKLLSRLAVTEAQQRRLFFEKQLIQTKSKLIDAEKKLKNSGVTLSLLKATPAAAVSEVAQLQAKITAQQIKIGSMRSYLTPAAPELKQAESELAALLAQAERNNKSITNDADSSADYVALFRDVRYYETLFDLFARQFELAKVDEAKEGAVIQVLDIAYPPERKSKPNKLLIAVSTFLSSLALFAFFIAARAFWQEWGQRPNTVDKIVRIKNKLN